MGNMVQKGQWMVLPYSAVKHLPNLHVSPTGMVPQHDRRPRTIVDYTYSGVNQDTQPLAPKEAMQFGKALTRVLTKIVQADPCHGPVHLIKIDVANGFYRIHLPPHQIPALGVSFPPAPDGTLLVVFPLCLPMGWVESPPYFCMATETIADYANARLQLGASVAKHRLGDLADSSSGSPDSLASSSTDPRTRKLAATTAIPKHPPGPRRKPVKYVDVYVDDFIGLAQGPLTTCSKVRDHLLTAIDQVFRPASPLEGKQRQEPISVKKLGKGDGQWSTQKQILGWELDTLAQTIQLPAWRLKRLEDLLSEYPRTKRRVATYKWQRALGELRSMCLAIPGLRGLFSLLQEALKVNNKPRQATKTNNQPTQRVKLTPQVHDFLDDVRWIVGTLQDRPT